MKPQEYEVVFWPKGKPADYGGRVITAKSKEAARIDIETCLAPIANQFVIKIKRKGYNWTGRGISWHFRQREARLAGLPASLDFP